MEVLPGAGCIVQSFKPATEQQKAKLVMSRSKGKPILVANVNKAESRWLISVLEVMGRRPRLATSTQDVLGLLRREVFSEAIISAELMKGEKPLLAYLAEFSLVEHTIAIGDPCNGEMEASARLAGVDSYLIRPILIEDLEAAILGFCPDEELFPELHGLYRHCKTHREVEFCSLGKLV